jgi:hypothetical protein
MAVMSRVAGQQDIGSSGYSRAVAMVAAWQWQRLHEGLGGSAEAAAGRQRQRGSSRAMLAAAAR